MAEGVHTPRDVMEQGDADKSRPQQDGQSGQPTAAGQAPSGEGQGEGGRTGPGSPRNGPDATVGRQAGRPGAMGVPARERSRARGGPPTWGRCGTTSPREHPPVPATGRTQTCRSDRESGGRRNGWRGARDVERHARSSTSVTTVRPGSWAAPPRHGCATASPRANASRTDVATGAGWAGGDVAVGGGPVRRSRPGGCDRRPICSSRARRRADRRHARHPA